MTAGNALAWLISVASGLVLWRYANWAQGTVEPWDGSDYLSVYVPLAMLLCFALGILFPEKAWRWSLALFVAQWPVMILAGSNAGPLFMIGVALTLTYALIGALFAWSGSGIRRWIERKVRG